MVCYNLIMDVTEGLNTQQRAAVTHGDGPLLVVAGAGTGKTQVITRRIAYLVNSGKAKPTEVLALTFTEKAAREMADRLHDLIGWQSFQVPVMTFNAFGAELLGQYATHIGRSVRGGLVNRTQKVLLLRQQFADIELEYYGPQADLYGFLDGIIEYIERLQNAGVSSARYRQFVDGIQATTSGEEAERLEQRDLASLYELYDQVKSRTGTYDYSDQLAIPLSILQQRSNLVERLQRQYRYVLIDEYQDTSPVQDQLLRLLVPKGGNIFAVGDDDQAIYGFRGADISNILSFAEHFAVEQPQALIENYRSGQEILDAAYRLIQHNDPERLEVRLHLDKRLKAQKTGSVVRFTPYSRPLDEQQAVVMAIKTRLDSGAVPEDIAILARSHDVLKTYAKGLRAQGVPFVLSTAANIFEQRELISLWYLLEWLGFRASDESIGHVIMGPFIGWTAAAYGAVLARARDDLSSVEQALRQLADEGLAPAAELVSRLDGWRQWSAELPVSQLAYRLVFETGLADRLRTVAEQRSGNRIGYVFEDLHLLLTQMQDFEMVAPDMLLAGYLADFPKPPLLETREMVGDDAGVRLLTVHAAKGLEFSVVYVVGCTGRAWSERNGGGRAVPEGLVTEEVQLPPEHEQRRLMYVAATRAKDELWLSAATMSNGGQRQAASPFVTELIGYVAEEAPTRPAENTVDKMVQKIQHLYPLKQEYTEQRLPFESADGWLDLGVGALGLYERCPYEFYLQYVLNISHPFGPQLAFGVALHGAIQSYYESVLHGERPDLKVLHDRLDELWSSRGYESQALAEAARKRAHEALERFYNREPAVARKPLASELKIVFELPESSLRLRGRIDALFEVPAGVEIRDFKTGLKHDSEKLASDAKDSFQLRTYALAYEAMNGVRPAGVTLDYVVTGAEGTAELTDRILANHRQKLAKLAEQIRAREFAPAPPSAFHHCAAFTYYGPEYDDGANDVG